MKHFTLISWVLEGRLVQKLLDQYGEPVQEFDIYASTLYKRLSLNTQISYGSGVAHFIDYLHEGQIVLADTHKYSSLSLGNGMGAAQHKVAIEAYNDYLLYGDQAGSEFARAIHKGLPSPLLKTNSASLRLAALRDFLKISSEFHIELKSSERFGDPSHSNIRNSQPSQINQSRSLKSSQRLAIQEKSLLGSVVAGGAKLTRNIPSNGDAPNNPFSEKKVFPFDKIIPFINMQRSYRDRAYYALGAAAGLRGHEALQLLMQDIDLKKSSVKLINPNLRKHHPSYAYLAPEDRLKLAWKGRASEDTLLIEPYASIFFENLELYIKHEYISHGLHQFAFQYIHGKKKGQPYFLSHPSTMQERFNNSARKLGLPSDVDGFHCLRHSYGTYALNFFPRLDGGHGLPMSIVQKLMGHSSMAATAMYAHIDRDLLMEELEYANKFIYQRGKPASVLEIKITAMQNRLALLTQEFERLNNA